MVRTGADLFAKAFDASPLAMALVDARGVVIRVNPSFARAVGCAAAELVRANLSDYFVDRQGNGSWLRTGEDGERLVLSVDAEPLDSDPDGVYLATLGIYPQAIGSINEHSMSLALEASKTGLWTRDLRSGQIQWSAELTEMFGFAPGAFDGTLGSYMDLVLEEYRPTLRQAVNECIVNHSDYEVEFRFRRLDGAIRWMNARGRAIYDEDDRPVMLVGAGIDTTERRQTEEALSRSEQRNKLFFGMSAVGAALVEVNGRQFVEVNDKLCSITGYSRKELVGMTIDQLTHPEDLESDKERYANLVKGGVSTASAVKRYVRKDGQVVWVQVDLTVLRSENGEPDMTVGLIQDVTVRKASEDALRDSENRLKLALKAAKLGIWDVDVATGKVHQSPEMARMTGTELSGPESRLEDWRRSIEPQDWAVMWRDFESALHQGEEFSGECRVLQPDGSYRWLAPRAIVVRDEQNQPTRVVGVAKDITEIRHSEKALIDAEERLRLAVKAAGLGIWQWDLRSGDLNWSEQVRIQFDVDPQTPLNYTLFESRVAPEDRERLTRAIEVSIRDSAELMIDFRTVVRDGSERWIAFMGHVFRGPDGKPATFIGMTQDITHRKESEEVAFRMNAILEQRVQERTEELEAANRELEGFTYTVSHDLRAPLRAIMSTSRILLEEHAESLSSEATGELERQSAAAKRLGDLIDDLLKLARLARQPLVRESVDISELAVEVVADAPGPKAQVSIEPGIIESADPKLVKLLLQNLIENAYKFAMDRERPEIEIGRNEEDEIFVRDHGIGFDEQYAERIFLPFERLHRETDYPGTGIGLANVRRIVDRHGGTVRATAEPGKGATFFFRLNPAERPNRS